MPLINNNATRYAPGGHNRLPLLGERSSVGSLMHRLLGLLRSLKRCSWLTSIVVLIVSLALALIAVPGDPVGPYIDWDGTVQSGWSERLYETIERRYSTGDLGPKEQVIVNQYRHGWPLPCLTRGIGRVVLRTRTTYVVLRSRKTRTEIGAAR